MLRVLENTVRSGDLVGGGRDRLASVADGLWPAGVWAIVLDGINAREEEEERLWVFTW